MVETIKLRHSIDAKHVQNIGEQSVSSPIQAILELVKNSYDADARECTVRFYGESPLVPLNIHKIEITDDGVGMTVEDIRDKWMRIGTQSKTRDSYSPLYGRRVSGEKGMGHFAVQKLGNHVRLVSTPRDYEERDQTAHPGKTLELVIDWKRYEPGMLFDEVENSLEVIDGGRPHGIAIEITDLKYQWTLEDVKSVQRVLGNLLVPRMLQKSVKNPFRPRVSPDGFALDGEVESNLEMYAPYKFAARLRGNTAQYSILRLNRRSNKHVNAEPIGETMSSGSFKVERPVCGDADFELLYYRDPDLTDGKWVPERVLNKKMLQEQQVGGWSRFTKCSLSPSITLYLLPFSSFQFFT